MKRFSALIDALQGMNHDDPDCPEDDTCRCANVAVVDKAFKDLEALVERVAELECASAKFVHPELRPNVCESIKDLGRTIGERCPRGTGFALLIFDFGKGGYTNYVSNAQHSDMIKALRECASAIEKAGN